MKLSGARLRFNYAAPEKQKAQSFELGFLLVFLAPRPGLEPGTYGLTVSRFDSLADLINLYLPRNN